MIVVDILSSACSIWSRQSNSTRRTTCTVEFVPRQSTPRVYTDGVILSAAGHSESTRYTGHRHLYFLLKLSSMYSVHKNIAAALVTLANLNYSVPAFLVPCKHSQ